MKKQTIKEMTENIKNLQEYEEAKVRVLNREFNNLRSVQMPTLLSNEKINFEEEEMKDIRDEINTFRAVLKRLHTVIKEQISNFKSKKEIVKKLDQQLKALYEMDRLAVFYRNTNNLEHLRKTYNKMYELVENFKSISKSITFVGEREKAKAA